MDRELVKRISFLLGIAVFIIVVGTQAFAAKPSQQIRQLVIDIVVADPDSESILIYGNNFDNGASPVVTLGG